jgi:hypothetical protein
LIEIGRDSGITLAFRRATTTLGGLSALLGIIWLIRQPLGLEQYSLTLLLTGFGLFFLGRLLRTETNSGPGRALLSILWNMTAVFVGITLTIWIFGWIASLQSDVFPATVSNGFLTLYLAQSSQVSAHMRRKGPASPVEPWPHS